MMDATYFVFVIVVVAAMLVTILVQLAMMILFEHPYYTLRRIRMVVYGTVAFTLVYRLFLFADGEAIVTPAGLGIGATTTLAMIILEYVRARETSPH